MLILVGAGIIVYEATHRLVDRRRGRVARRRHRRDGLLGRRQPRRLHRPLAAGEGARIAGAGGRRRAPAHRRADLGRGAASASPWSRSPATPPSTRSPRWSSRRRSSCAGIRIIRRSSGVLVDEALPRDEMDRIEAAIAARPHRRGRRLPQAARPPRRQPPPHRPPRPVPLRHQPRARPRAGPRDAGLDRGRDPAAEVLIHAEPETSFREPDDASRLRRARSASGLAAASREGAAG